MHREQDRDQQPESVRRHVQQGDDCLEVLIHQHGAEPINTLASRVEYRLTRSLPQR